MTISDRDREDFVNELNSIVFAPFNSKSLRAFIEKYKSWYGDTYQEIISSDDESLKAIHQNIRNTKRRFYIEQGNPQEFDKLLKKYSG